MPRDTRQHRPRSTRQFIAVEHNLLGALDGLIPGGISTNHDDRVEFLEALEDWLIERGTAVGFVTEEEFDLKVKAQS